jgi:ABC-type sugar transport system ATPase subunit
MIALSGISKRFGAVVALNDVELTVAAGEVIALAGENGSGKSTLVKVLSGVVMPDAGHIRIDGEVVEFSSPRDALDRGVSLVAQELTVLPTLSVYENITLPLLRERALRVVNRAEMIARSREVLARLGVDTIDPRQTLGTLGPVDQTFVEVAKALVTNPRVLILDEATSRLGADEVGSLLTLVRRLRDQDLSTVMITHRIAEITSTADRAVVLRDGRLAGNLDRGELSEKRLVKLMVGRDIVPRDRLRAETASKPVLEVRDVIVAGTKSSVSLTVGAGEVVGLAGLVGAGRTELLEAIFGLRRRSGGTVTLTGTPVIESSVRRARQAGLALVPEERRTQGLIVGASIETNYLLGALSWFQLFRRRRARREVRGAVATFGIKAPDVQAGVSTLSGGNQQKVVIARALSTRPQILLLDEPTRGVDIGAREEIYLIIEKNTDKGMGVLLASSDMTEVLGVSDRVLVMHEHEIVGELHGDQITEENIALLSAGGEVESSDEH